MDMTPFHCIRLVVESRNPRHGFWERVAVFKPEYVYEDRIVPRWYWWPKKIRVLTNRGVAYIAARTAAIKQAKDQRGEVRVMEYYHHGPFDVLSEVIWRDGKFLDC